MLSRIWKHSASPQKSRPPTAPQLPVRIGVGFKLRLLGCPTAGALNTSVPMKPRSPSPSIPSNKADILKIAAAFAVVSLVGIGALALSQGPEGQTYSTTIGGRETLTFDDGSWIELNTNTTVRVAYEGRRRDAWLDKGEACFNVVHDPARSFTVTLGERRVTDLGTKFFIRRDPDRIRLALVEGRARFDTSLDPALSQQIVLTPGDIVTATAEKVSLERERAIRGSNRGLRRHNQGRAHTA